MAISYVAAGAATSGPAPGTLTPLWPTHQAGDTGILINETEGDGVAQEVVSGWTQVGSAESGSGPSNGDTKISVWIRRATSSSESAPSVSRGTSHGNARIIVFRDTAGTDIVEVSDTFTEAATNTSISGPSITPTVDGSMIVVVSATGIDTTLSGGFSGGGLSWATAAENGASSGADGSYAAAYALQATAGAVAGSGTWSSAGQEATIAFSLLPFQSIDVDYWSTNYWAANYWSSAYWAGSVGAGTYTGSIAATTELALAGVSQEFWSEAYWNANYWASNYWGGSNPASFVGTFNSAGQRTGTIAASVDLSAAFAGLTVQVENLDFTLSVAVPWVDMEFAGYSGTVSVTFGDDASAITGQFIALGGFIGDIATTLDDSASNFDGTHVAPANRTGTIATTMDNSSSDLVGQAFGAGTSIGTIAVMLENSPADFDGTLSPGTKAGTIAGDLVDAATADIRGVFAESSVQIGAIQSSLGDASAALIGVTEAGPLLSAVRQRHRVHPSRTRAKRMQANRRRRR